MGNPNFPNFDLETFTVYVSKRGQYENVSEWKMTLPVEMGSAFKPTIIEAARGRGFYWRNGFNIGVGFEDGSFMEIAEGLPPEHSLRSVG